ncbi:unnamed protein product [Hymenolepis diminuta]|uniref:Uncharacterized protein n=1 Tax=Hymenolepis diminuta TaxID=6216 RepID=A0A564YQA9_HYMDI|nr:unnamed protein product [Hymenolepis diminuta]
MNWPSWGGENSIFNALMTHSHGIPEFVGRVHEMMNENLGKSIRDILLKIIKCLREQQYRRNVVK